MNILTRNSFAINEKRKQENRKNSMSVFKGHFVPLRCLMLSNLQEIFVLLFSAIWVKQSLSLKMPINKKVECVHGSVFETEFALPPQLPSKYFHTICDRCAAILHCQNPLNVCAVTMWYQLSQVELSCQCFNLITKNQTDRKINTYIHQCKNKTKKQRNT